MPPAKNTSSSSSKTTNNGSSTKATSTTQPDDKSYNSFYKEGGWGNMKNFAESHGLRLDKHEDIEEAKAIRDGYREQDQRAWEEAQAAKGGKN
ncbi:uncharacterized protein LY89DRAFT_688818 [Mollisia scopiformis]|uniref:Uncharacterized protein n=1 Tax=Mollisia scopiformis TaxID=149040 RepID=A0A194WUI8_MOLSC|nr:uncharacterized protein LY89DRAFT_688818 [Mollisia scopiformis]KUJ11626.1 hypothetical protein LY89DRAFT_688818 [Mollisia scopiformis]